MLPKASLVLALMLLPTFPAAAASSPGCGETLVRSHAGALAGWGLRAVEAGTAGVVAVWERPAGDGHLLVGLRVEPRGLVTFQSLRRERRHETVPADVLAALAGWYEEVGRDPAARACPELAAGLGSGEQASFEALTAADDRLLPPLKTPKPEEGPRPDPARGRDLWDWGGWAGLRNAALAYGALLVPAVGAFCALRAWRRRR